ncbi:orexin receptor type 2-like [Haliotis cracherodii]|uniref:orexin receptor type 2-like n=1 Tax=Haliotis cracherodii TaxID=6455 RepID=UPI0039EBE555
MSRANWSRATCKHLYEVNGTIQQCYFTDDDLLHAIYSYIEPKPHEWVFTALYVIVFVLGLTGNFLVCYAVWKNRQLRTSTNLFLVNLAVADFLVITLCLPPSYIQSIWETWFLGDAMCRIVEYYQTVTIIISVLTLTAISIERWFAICHPLTFKETKRRVVISIVVIWLLAHVLSIPRLLLFKETPDQMIPQNLTLLMTSCTPDNSMSSLALNYDIFIFVTFYLVPVVIMGYTYVSIAACLWSSTKTGSHLTEGEQSAVTAQLQARRRAARMLIVVVLVFIMCFLPMYTWNLMRLTDSSLIAMIHPHSVSICTLSAHWLVYFNSSINPIIYNFMSGKFRKEFKSVCACIYLPCDGKDMRRYNNHELEPLSTTKGGRRYIGKDSDSYDVSRSRTVVTEA